MAELADVTAFDPASYQAQLHARLAELQDLVELNIAEAACEQKTAYDRHSAPHSFMVGDPMWLSVPTAGKLSPRWEGKWTVKTVLSQINMEITDGRQNKVAHINHLQHCIHSKHHEHESDRVPKRWDSCIILELCTTGYVYIVAIYTHIGVSEFM